MSKLILVAILLFGTTDVAARGHRYQTKQACQTQPDPRVYSAWRIIDGKQCWYRGKRGLARENLHWTEPEGTAPRRRPKEIAPPTIATPYPKPETLTDRLNYYFAVLSSQTYLQTPSGALPLAMAGPWLGTPIPPGLQPVPKAPSEWTGTAPEPEPAPTSWWKRLWEKWPFWWR